MRAIVFVFVMRRENGGVVRIPIRVKKEYNVVVSLRNGCKIQYPISNNKESYRYVSVGLYLRVWFRHGMNAHCLISYTSASDNVFDDKSVINSRMFSWVVIVLKYFRI